MPRGPEPKTPLSEREKLQLKQRGDNLRRRQGLGSAKYAEFFFRHRSAYPFTRKTFPSPMGRVEAGNEAWDGVDPETGKMAEWVKSSTTTTLSTMPPTTTTTTTKHHHHPSQLGGPNDDGCGSWRNRSAGAAGAGRRIDDDLDACHYRLVKRLRSAEPQAAAAAAAHHHHHHHHPPTHSQLPQQPAHPLTPPLPHDPAAVVARPHHDYTANTAASHTPPSSPPSSSPSPKSIPAPGGPPDTSSSDPDPSPAPCRPIQRDLKLLMDALRRIPTPVRAARAIEGMLSRREVQRALEKYGTGAELGLSSKELAAISVLQNGVTCKSRW